MATTNPAAGSLAERIEQFERVGLTFDVTDRGPVDGDVVVLLHGFPQRASSWDAVASRLHEHGLRTLAPDQRGYSPGARPTRRRDYRIDELVGDVCALIDSVGREVHLVGHDWGAAVAWLVAARHPAVRSLTSVSVPHPAAFVTSVLSPGQLRKSWYVGFFQLPFLAERAASRGRLQERLRGSGMTDHDIATFERGVIDHGALPGGLAWYRAIPRSLLGAHRLWRERVHVPVTHVWSDQDSALGGRTADLAPRWAAGEFELRVLPGLSHWLPEQAPDELAAIVLERVARSRPAHQSS
jgi:pimeloyl-ACP methyl ester carboxylesterase